MTLGLGPSYATLCVVQGVLVLAGREPRPVRALPLVGVLLPVAALALGVALVRAFAGAGFLAALATVAAPVLAAAAPFLLRVRPRWIGPIVAAGLYAVAWLASGLLADAAGVALIAGACLTLAALVAAFAPRPAIAVGLVLLVVLDVVLVWGTPQIGPTTETLHAAQPPSVALAGRTRELPALQDVTFGSALMGWLDLAAPALLGCIAAGSRARAAAVTTAAALLWGLLLAVTSPIPATVPVLAGLGLAWAAWKRTPSTPPGSTGSPSRRPSTA